MSGSSSENFSPIRVYTARLWAQETGYDQLFIIGVRPDGRVDGVSYGKNRPKCEQAGETLDLIMDQIFECGS